MDEFNVQASALRSNLSVLLSSVAYGGTRLVVIRGGREVAAIVAIDELARLRKLPLLPPPISPFEARQQLFAALERGRNEARAEREAAAALSDARERKDPLAIAHAEQELETAARRLAETQEEVARLSELEGRPS